MTKSFVHYDDTNQIPFKKGEEYLKNIRVWHAICFKSKKCGFFFNF